MIIFLDLGTLANRILWILPNAAAIGIIYFLFTPKIHRFPLLFLWLLLVSSSLALKFEQFIFGVLTLVFSGTAYLVVGFSAIKQLSKIKANWFLGIYFIITLLVLGYFLFELVQISKDQYTGFLQFILFNIANLALIFMLASALLLVHQNPTKIAMVFLGFAFVFILSEIVRAASYYSETRINLFIYGSRVLYVFALALLLNCCQLIEAEERQKS
ncbi:MAG: hypothetical protein KDC91_00190 [Flavobacteriaceae bacterium]|nr:hypothetical protein [Flavobacteriaceae bacterium]